MKLFVDHARGVSCVPQNQTNSSLPSTGVVACYVPRKALANHQKNESKESESQSFHQNLLSQNSCLSSFLKDNTNPNSLPIYVADEL